MSCSKSEDAVQPAEFVHHSSDARAGLRPSTYPPWDIHDGSLQHLIEELRAERRGRVDHNERVEIADEFDAAIAALKERDRADAPPRPPE
jgi:hypothetical protein